MRFERQIPVIGVDGQRRLRDSTVAVAGCGGLGCNVITQLCLAGIGNIRIIDSDVISESNLNRQFVHCGKEGSKVRSMAEWIRRISDTEVTSFDERLTDDSCQHFAEGADIIVDCLDNNASRMILNRFALSNDVPLVHGAVNGMFGQVFLMVPGETACLSCFLGKDGGDGSNIGAAVSAIASVQAMEAIKFLTGKGELSKGELISIDLEKNSFRRIPIFGRDDCQTCGKELD